MLVDSATEMTLQVESRLVPESSTQKVEFYPDENASGVGFIQRLTFLKIDMAMYILLPKGFDRFEETLFAICCETLRILLIKCGETMVTLER